MRRAWAGLALAAMTACGGTKTTASVTSTSSTYPIVVSTAAPVTRATVQATTTTTAALIFSVGDKVSYTDGSTAQVFSYVTKVVSTNQFEQPAAGNTYTAADVQICAGSAVESVNPASFELAMADNTRARETIAVKSPALHLTSVGPGDCVRGFVTFEAPLAVAVAYVVYTESRTPTRWKVQ